MQLIAPVSAFTWNKVSRTLVAELSDFGTKYVPESLFIRSPATNRAVRFTPDRMVKDESDEDILVYVYSTDELESGHMEVHLLND